MRVADFIAERLRYLGCRDVYMVTGGAAMYLNDAFGRTFSPNVHNLHNEQSCSMAAESYARILNRPALVNVTAGPGSINAINGVFGAFVDSIPMIVVSGQAKRETMKTTYNIKGLRQLGDQELDIVSMIGGVCKFATTIIDPLKIVELVDHCYYVATSGRPGPVWLDVPIDVQSFPLPNEYASKVFSSNKFYDQKKLGKVPYATDQEIKALALKLLTSKRPTLYVGNGIRLSKSYHELLIFLEEWPVSTVTGWNSNDLLWDDHPCYCGRPGTVGNRAGNFAVQFSQCVLTVGCRLNIRLTSYNWKSFAKNAWKCHIDIDQAELDKPILNTDLKIHSTASGLFPRLSTAMNELVESHNLDRPSILLHWKRWISFNRKYLQIYSAVSHALPSKDRFVNPYRLVDMLSSKLNEKSVTVCADGTACVVGFQAFRVKKGQRLFHNSGCASMGYDLPAAIGAYHATSEEVICIAGDGSIMMNLQELAYIGGLGLPIKIILLNNGGYHSIRQTQNNYFPDNPVGCGIESGLPFPNFSILSPGFKIKYLSLDQESFMNKTIDKFLAYDGPVLLEVILDLDQDFAPKLASKKLYDGTMVTAELEDMTPLLDDKVMSNIQSEAFKIT